MLVLTLDHKNAIELDGGIRIELIEGKNGQSRLGIVAPKAVAISRVRRDGRPLRSAR
ncbi:MAG: carbon storage regulator [Oceanospirillaceae bacterium]|nr:carbon storage regulator [Oceanospirillaceae bacterium]